MTKLLINMWAKIAEAYVQDTQLNILEHDWRIIRISFELAEITLHNNHLESLTIPLTYLAVLLDYKGDE